MNTGVVHLEPARVARITGGLYVAYIVADNYYLNGQFPQGSVNPVTSIKTAIAIDPFNDMYLAEVGLAYQDIMIGWISQAQQNPTNAHDQHRQGIDKQ